MAAKRQNPPTEQTVWLTVEQAAGSLGVSNWTVLRWAKDGDPRLPGYKVWDEHAGDQGRFRFKKEDVDALSDSGAVAIEAAPAPLAGSVKLVSRSGGGKRTAKE